MLFVTLALSGIFLAVVNGVAFSRQGKGVGWATLCSFAAVVPLFFCTLALILPLNALAVAVGGVVCWMVTDRPRWFLGTSLATTLGVYAAVGGQDVWTWHRLKKDYPLESLAGRLAYEDRARAESPSDGEASAPAGDHLASLEERLDKETWRLPGANRTRSLEHLHAGIVRQFIDSPNFGVARRIFQPRTISLERPFAEEGPIPQPSPPSPPGELVAAPVRAVAGPDLLTVHDGNTVNFLDPRGFGYVRDREHVAGFRPHQFHNAPGAPERWRVNRLELVGLLRHERPAVYLSMNFPRMEELSEAPTRPLDAFETEALAGLRRGEDLIVQEAPRQMRLLGSLRAGRQCLSCHGARRGELLGAFSYQLAAEQPPSR